MGHDGPCQLGGRLDVVVAAVWQERVAVGAQLDGCQPDQPGGQGATVGHLVGHPEHLSTQFPRHSGQLPCLGFGGQFVANWRHFEDQGGVGDQAVSQGPTALEPVAAVVLERGELLAV